MARFFFNIRDVLSFIPDREGSEHRDLKSAMDDAEASARELATQYVDNKKTPIGTCVDVADEHGLVLATLSLTEVFEQPTYPRFAAPQAAATSRARANNTLAEAESRHLATLRTMANERNVLDARADAEDKRWALERGELEAAIN